jgi:NAD(P)-dependent dehydrogenase (short-subunit alcohol dehydrogenase family)
MGPVRDRLEEVVVGVLERRVAVVAGGTSGIGAAIATSFASEGAGVVIAGRRETDGERMAESLGGNGSFVRADVAVEADVEALFGQVVDRFGRVDILVNSAGTPGRVGSFIGADLTAVRCTFAVHVEGTLAAIKHAAPVMVAQGSGSVINVASIGGVLAGWTSPDYSAAKAAVIQLTRSSAVELAESGVRVNCLSPGPIITGIFAKAAGIDPREADQHANLLEPVFAERLELWQPMRRPGIPDDVARAAVWLASDAASFISGQNLAVDGGITAGRPRAVSAADRAAVGRALQPQAATS